MPGVRPSMGFPYEIVIPVMKNKRKLGKGEELCVYEKPLPKKQSVQQKPVDVQKLISAAAKEEGEGGQEEGKPSKKAKKSG